MNTICLEVIDLLKAIAQPAIALAAVWLGWRLGVRSQRGQRRLDRLDARLTALSEVMRVADNIPPDLTAQDLAARLETDEEFRKSLFLRLVRLFGLRIELIGSLDPELVGFIDTRLRPLYVARMGSYELVPDRAAEFGRAACDLCTLVQRVERKLLAEQETLIN